MKSSLFLRVTCCALAWFGCTFASAEDFEFTGNVTLTSDYSFRGVSQTSRDPAIQGGLDLDFGNGFAIGTWSSNVNFGDSTSQELDLYASYSGSLTEDIEFSLIGIRFEYPSEGDCCDYMEFGGSISISSFTVGVMFSPEYLGDGNPGLSYPYVDYSAGPFGLHLGISMSEGIADTETETDDSYIDYSASLGAPFAGLDISLAVVGSDLDIGPEAETRLILSISRSL